MKFMLTFTLKPETKGRDEAIARFKKTGGQPPISRGFDLLWIVPVVEDVELSQVLQRASR